MSSMRVDVTVCKGVRMDPTRVIEASGLEGKRVPATGHTLNRMVEVDGRRYKVRAYASAAAAARELDLVSRMPELFAPYLGRRGHCLAMEFVEGEALSGERRDWEQIGEFMARVAEREVAPLTLDDFETRCEAMRRAGIFLEATLRRMRAYYAKAKEAARAWNAEYLDGLPKNFVRTREGRLVCVDGKHLHTGPRGLGLIKLECHLGNSLGEEEMASAREAYCEGTGIGEIYQREEYRTFLLFYYCLMFFAIEEYPRELRVVAGAVRNWWKRERVFEVAGVPEWLRAIERLRWRGPRWAGRWENRARRARMRLLGRDEERLSNGWVGGAVVVSEKAD